MITVQVRPWEWVLYVGLMLLFCIPWFIGAAVIVIWGLHAIR